MLKRFFEFLVSQAGAKKRCIIPPATLRIVSEQRVHELSLNWLITVPFSSANGSE